MTSRWVLLTAFAAAALSGGSQAEAQLRVIVDGQVQDVPAGVVRTISWRPGGRQTVRDEPFAGYARPGAATITNVETQEEDDRGRFIGTRIVTRIVPIRETASAQPTRQAAAYAPAPTGAQIRYSAAEPRPFDFPAREQTKPEVLRIQRDPVTGHFITTIKINGVDVRAIVDTGAANTILAPRDARATGAAGEIVDSQRMVGIGGYTMLNIARIRSIEVGGQDLGGISTPIGQEGLGYTLLGQSEITRLGRIVIEDGTMTITPRGMQMTSR